MYCTTHIWAGGLYNQLGGGGGGVNLRMKLTMYGEVSGSYTKSWGSILASSWVNWDMHDVGN